MSANRVRESIRARRIAVAMMRQTVLVPFKSDGASASLTGELGVLPVYAIPGPRLINSEFNKGWRWGWCYFWVSDDAPGIVVNIARGGRDGPVFSSLSQGLKAKRIANALHLANQQVESSRIRYRPRLLRLSPLHMEAVWLNSDPQSEPEHFYSLTSGIDSADFIRIAQKRAEAMELRRPA